MGEEGRALKFDQMVVHKSQEARKGEGEGRGTPYTHPTDHIL